MRYLLFFICVLFISCSSKKSPAGKKQQATAATQVDSTSSSSIDSLKDAAKPTVAFVTGQFNFREHKYFVKVPDKYTNKVVYLQKRTYQAFKAMHDSAQKAGINLIIVSGTRNFAYQKGIWDRKWNASKASSDLAKAKGILKFSSMPMTSRHHWGTDMDLNNLNNSYFAKGQGKKEYDWLKAHANSFGFYQPYTNKKLHGRTGYEEEKWHWSYMPLSSIYLKYYNEHVTNADIKGFKGAYLAGKIDMVKNYVDGVSQKVLNYGK